MMELPVLHGKQEPAHNWKSLNIGLLYVMSMLSTMSGFSEDFFNFGFETQFSDMLNSSTNKLKQCKHCDIAEKKK
jgi:hypothetical protein